MHTQDIAADQDRIGHIVLERQLDEAIRIGEGPDAITVTVHKIRRDSVKLGIHAAVRIPVVRLELLGREQANEQDDVCD